MWICGSLDCVMIYLASGGDSLKRGQLQRFRPADLPVTSLKIKSRGSSVNWYTSTIDTQYNASRKLEYLNCIWRKTGSSTPLKTLRLTRWVGTHCLSHRMTLKKASMRRKRFEFRPWRPVFYFYISWWSNHMIRLIRGFVCHVNWGMNHSNAKQRWCFRV